MANGSKDINSTERESSQKISREEDVLKSGSVLLKTNSHVSSRSDEQSNTQDLG